MAWDCVWRVRGGVGGRVEQKKIVYVVWNPTRLEDKHVS